MIGLIILIASVVVIVLAIGLFGAARDFEEMTHRAD